MVLVVMTLTMFLVNIIQLATLNRIVDTLWITLFPALLFGAFMVVFVTAAWQQHKTEVHPIVAFDSHRCKCNIQQLGGQRVFVDQLERERKP